MAALLTITWGCMPETEEGDSGPDTSAARDTIVISDTLSVSDTLTGAEASPDAPTEEWTVAAIAQPGAARGIAVLQDIRAGAHAGFDRMVIEFEEGILPGYYISYLEEQPMECGSGESISLAGDAVLEVRMEPARGYTDEGRSTLDHGPRRFGLTRAREAKVSCDFEAVFTVVIGLAGRSGFRVFPLESPTRLVIDVQH